MKGVLTRRLSGVCLGYIANRGWGNPQELKAPVSICVWILFIYGCIMLINTVVQSIFGGLGAKLTMAGGGIAMVSFILAAVAARIRQELE